MAITTASHGGRGGLALAPPAIRDCQPLEVLNEATGALRDNVVHHVRGRAGRTDRLERCSVGYRRTGSRIPVRRAGHGNRVSAVGRLGGWGQHVEFDGRRDRQQQQWRRRDHGLEPSERRRRRTVHADQRAHRRRLVRRRDRIEFAPGGATGSSTSGTSGTGSATSGAAGAGGSGSMGGLASGTTFRLNPGSENLQQYVNNLVEIRGTMDSSSGSGSSGGAGTSSSGAGSTGTRREPARRRVRARRPAVRHRERARRLVVRPRAPVRARRARPLAAA